MSRLVDAMQTRIDQLEGENRDLREALARARQTQEDIALGVQMQCAGCGCYKPCSCDH